MKITQDVRKCAAEQGLNETVAFDRDMQQRRQSSLVEFAAPGKRVPGA
jgi:hypothetical protein